MSLVEKRMRIIIIILTGISLFMPVEAGSKIAVLFYLGIEQIIQFGQGLLLVPFGMMNILLAIISVFSNRLNGSHLFWSTLSTTLVLPAYLFWVYAIPFLLICNIILLPSKKGRFRVILHKIYRIWLFFAFISSLYECSGFGTNSYWTELGFWLVPLILLLAIIVECVLLFKSKQPLLPNPINLVGS